MRADAENTIYSHNKYIRQLKAYISEAHDKFSPTVIVCTKSGLMIKNGQENCAGNHKGICSPSVLKIEPPDDGTLFYSSREEPLLTASYYIVNDPDIIVAGKSRLREWKQNFIDEILPEHVREGESSKWSVGECKYCKHKAPYCKADHKQKVKQLEKSNLIPFTKNLRPSYDYQQTRESVLARWR